MGSTGPTDDTNGAIISIESSGWMDPPAEEELNRRAPENSDEALALEFSAKYDGLILYVAVWLRWKVWSGIVWEHDKTLLTLDLCRKHCREKSNDCKNEREAHDIASASTVAAVLRLAQADRRQAVTTDVWDPDPFMLNTPGGVVDLRTGSIRPNEPADFCTKVTASAPGGDCPLWRKFLERVTDADQQLMDYLQRVVGYMLTGSVKEHALFFLYGTGGNGKGVFVNTLTKLFNTYASVAAIETFSATSADRHPTDLAMLRGARLVAAQETEEGRHWAESRIKSITGGDPITARFMRQDFFTYQPNFKILIAGNHKPGLRNVDNAIRRRFNLVKFNVRIDDEEIDKDLPLKLEAELGGILAWAIEGAKQWHSVGLMTPPCVVDATTEYLKDQDSFEKWLNACTTPNVNKSEKLSDLFTCWSAYADRCGEPRGKSRQLSAKLETRFRSDHSKVGKIFHGLEINVAETVPPHWVD